MGLLLFGGCSNSHPAGGSSSVNELARELMLCTVTLDADKYATLLHPNVVAYYEHAWPGFLKATFDRDRFLINESASDFLPANVEVEAGSRDLFTVQEWKEARKILGKSLVTEAYRFSYKRDTQTQRMRVLVVQDYGRYYLILPDFPEGMKPPKSRK